MEQPAGAVEPPGGAVLGVHGRPSRRTCWATPSRPSWSGSRELANQDLLGLKQTAHRLKGGAAQLGLRQVWDCAQEVESLAADECMPELPDAGHATVAYLDRAVSALASRARG
jgi:hypothetical protein